MRCGQRWRESAPMRHPDGSRDLDLAKVPIVIGRTGFVLFAEIGRPEQGLPTLPCVLAFSRALARRRRFLFPRGSFRGFAL